MATIRCEHLAYGKLVQSPGGPIRSGLDHEHTGRSRGFPASLERRCVPQEIGIGAGPLMEWSQYPWLGEGGGIAVRPVIGAEGAWAVAVRVRGRSERGEHVDGRFYAQAHYLAIPLERWSFAALSGIAVSLRATPMLARDDDLPPIEVPLDEGAALPSGWLDEVAPLLEAVLSGVPFAFQDRSLPLAEAIARITRCLAAVPPALACRLSVGAGLVRMDEATALGHGLEARTPIYSIKGVRRGGEGLDLSRGRRYLEWLERACAGCGTTGEVARIVAEAFPGFAPAGAVPFDRGWAEVARQVADDLEENHRLHALQAWLDTRKGPPPEIAFSPARARLMKNLLADRLGQIWADQRRATDVFQMLDDLGDRGATLAAEDIFSGEDIRGLAAGLAEELPGHPGDLPRSAIRALLVHWKPLSKETRAGLADRLAEAIGPMCGAVLLDHPTEAAPGRSAGIALPFARRRLRESPRARYRLWKAIERQGESDADAARALVEVWAELPLAADEEPLLVLLHAALRGSALPRGFALSPREREAARRCLEVTAPTASFQALLAAIDQPRALAAILDALPLRAAAELSPPALGSVLRHCLQHGEERATWAARARAAGVEARPGWRLLVLLAQPPVADPPRVELIGPEGEGIAGSSPAGLLSLFRRGVVVGAPHLDRLALDPRLGALVLPDLLVLARAAQAARAQGLRRVIAAVSLREARARGASRREAEEALRPEPLWSRLRGLLGGPAGLREIHGALDLAAFALEGSDARERRALLDEAFPAGRGSQGGSRR